MIIITNGKRVFQLTTEQVEEMLWSFIERDIHLNKQLDREDLDDSAIEYLNNRRSIGNDLRDMIYTLR